MTPEEYLRSIGINLNTTCLLTVIDGYMRQPDLCQLLQDFLDLNNKKDTPDPDNTFV